MPDPKTVSVVTSDPEGRHRGWPLPQAAHVVQPKTDKDGYIILSEQDVMRIADRLAEILQRGEK